jgi:hypothetical protein
MMTVFSAKNPILKFNDGTNDSDKSEQQGMMHLFAGAMLAFRNSRAHEIVTGSAGYDRLGSLAKQLNLQELSEAKLLELGGCWLVRC